jgi:signal transduction histidine kinase
VNLAQLSEDAADQILATPGADPVPVLSALDCLRVAVSLYDSQHRLIYLNRHFRYIFRAMPPDQALIGRSYEELVRMEIDSGEIAPEQFASGEADYVANRCSQLTPGDYAPRDIHLADGRIIEVKMRATADGGWIALWGDATHARHAMGRLSTAIDLSADAFAFWDCEDRLVMCNPGFAKLHGAKDEAHLIGERFEDLIRDTVKRHLVKLDCDAEAWIEKRLEARRARVGALTVELASGHAYLVRERTTRDGGHATVYTDVTDRYRAETAFAEQGEALRATRQVLDSQANYLADLTKRLDQAEQGANTAKKTFLRTMSHELKTPLNAIIGFSDLLKSAAGQFSSEQVVEYAGLIHGAGGNLLNMLNQILDLTKIAAGRYALDRGPVPVRMLFDSARDLTCEMAEDKSLTIDQSDCGTLAVYGDESALNAMVDELLRNAVKFTQNGGTIRLTAEMRDERVLIVIADDGPGVSHHDIARIVEPFEQACRDTTAYAGGSGLGLPLVKALAELHDGQLILESRHGDGFTATLDLPAA